MRRTLLASVTMFALLFALAPGGAAAVEHVSESGTVAVYLLLDQEELGPFVVPVHREIGDTDAVAAAAVEALLEGPTAAEAASFPAVRTAIPGGVALNDIAITEGLATVDLSSNFGAGGGSFTMFARLAQLVYTVTQFPTVDGVAIELDGEPVTVFSAEGIDVTPPVVRADFDGVGVLPPVLVDWPHYGGPFEARLVGTSAVDEFSIQILDGDGRPLGAAVAMIDLQDARTVFDVTVPYVSITERFGIVLVEAENREESLREYPVTLAPTPVPVARGFDAACTAEVPDAGFVDVDADGTHAEAIDCIAWWDVTEGRTATTYEPAGTVTRGQMAAMLARAMETAGEDLTDDPASAFPDAVGTTHELAIDQLAELGIVFGRADGTYGPNLPVTRAQMASLLVRTFEYLADFELEPTRDYFVDDDGLGHEQSIDAAALAGLTEGVAVDRYAPTGELRRDQMASFMARLLDLLVVEGGVVLE